MKRAEYIKQGRRNRAAGIRFEAKVRSNLEEMGWIVDKWSNTVDSDKSNILKLVPAKRKYNPFKKVMVIGTGFPDFVAFKRKKSGGYEIVGVEVKRRGYLDKIEKDMCRWLLENKIFSKILIAKAAKEGRKINVEYIDFAKKDKK
jgi:hypothetical protein